MKILIFLSSHKKIYFLKFLSYIVIFIIIGIKYYFCDFNTLIFLILNKNHFYFSE